MDSKHAFEKRLEQRGVTRRQFMKYCGVIAGAIGLGPTFGPQIYEAIAASKRPPVLWLHMAECTGCTEAVLRSSNPSFEEIILDAISLDYHETLMAGAGADAEQLLYDSVENLDRYFCVVEGAIPTKDGGIYGQIGSRTMLSIAREVCSQASAIISLGNCSSFGGLPAAYPNPTGALGVEAALGSDIAHVPVVNIPGCPPNPIAFVGTVVNYLLNDRLPNLDDKGRPTFAYGRTVHSQCPYRERESRCLEDIGCKGPSTYNNCPTALFNEGSSWPVLAGHPCIGCSEPDFWDVNTPFYQENEEHEDDEDQHDGGYDD